MTLKTKMEKIINSSYNNIGGIVVRKKGKIGEFRYAPLVGLDIVSVYVKNAKDRITLIKEYIEPVFSGDDIR